jgi:hypothetical protein
VFEIRQKVARKSGKGAKFFFLAPFAPLREIVFNNTTLKTAISPF